jgi:hypothetical protein
MLRRNTITPGLQFADFCEEIVMSPSLALSLAAISKRLRVVHFASTSRVTA